MPSIEASFRFAALSIQSTGSATRLRNWSSSQAALPIAAAAEEVETLH